MNRNPFARWSRDEWLILLARWPERGVGKSRLAAAIGRDEAYELERAFLMDSLSWLAWAPALLIAFTPPSAAPDFRRCAPRARLRAQPDGDLGRRIHQAFSEAFAMGARRAIIVGSDSPNLPPAIVQSCRDGLAQADVVITPTPDGGFCALGLSRPAGDLFEGIRWSTALVLRQISQCARELGLTIRETEPWYDIDDSAALRRLGADLSLDGTLASHTAATLARINRH
jgi:rSAM/selenodomain-associated transferase 1